MTARVTLSCDGAWPVGAVNAPAFPCRAALHLDPEPFDTIGGELVDVDAVRERAEAAGWSTTRGTAGPVRDWCHAHTAWRAARLLELDPRWSGQPAGARSAVLDLVAADVAALARGVLGRLPDREQLAVAGIDPAAFTPTCTREATDR